MGKPKEKAKVVLPKAGDVARAKPLVAKVAQAKARLGKVREKHASTSDPRNRAARKRVKRAQRRLREVLKYEAARAKPAAPAGGEAPATPPAS
jgi:hypothetical protein